MKFIILAVILAVIGFALGFWALPQIDQLKFKTENEITIGAPPDRPQITLPKRSDMAGGTPVYVEDRP